MRALPRPRRSSKLDLGKECMECESEGLKPECRRQKNPVQPEEEERLARSADGGHVL